MMNSDYQIEDYVHDVDDLVASIRELSIFSGHEKDREYLTHKLTSINGISAILASKTAFMSFVNFDVQFQRTDIYVYHSVSRAVSAAKYLAERERKKLKVEMTGKSHGLVMGPPVFDFVPYVLLENAVKYSLQGGRITAEVREDLEEFEIRIYSVGPAWEDDEGERLFDKNFRGSQAQKVVSKGSGLGLYYARKALIELFDGTIRAEQEVEGPVLPVNGVLYRRTTFVVKIPKE